MDRGIAFVGAASNIGIRPYDNGVPQQLDRGPQAFRNSGVVKRLNADDLGDVCPPPCRDFAHPPGRPRNEQAVEAYSRTLADHVAAGSAGGRFVVVVGGDCSIALGALLGAGRGRGAVGLAYLDAHADFATPAGSQTGSAAGMSLALAVGLGDSVLAKLSGSSPLVREENVALVGRRDFAEQCYEHEALARSAILDLPDDGFWSGDVAEVSRTVLNRVGRAELDGFWIHVDADLLNPRAMPAVAMPEPGGPVFAQLARFLTPLVNHPRAIGLQLTLYDPSLDPSLTAAVKLVDLLANVLSRGQEGASP